MVTGVLVLLFLMMLCSSCATNKINTIKENCLASVVTYQDLVECAIKLKEN